MPIFGFDMLEVAVVTPPIVSIDSALSSSSGPSSGPESSSNIVFRFAGGGRVANEGGFLVIFRPYDNFDIIGVMCYVEERFRCRDTVVLALSMTERSSSSFTFGKKKSRGCAGKATLTQPQSFLHHPSITFPFRLWLPTIRYLLSLGPLAFIYTYYP